MSHVYNKLKNEVRLPKGRVNNTGYLLIITWKNKFWEGAKTVLFPQPCTLTHHRHQGIALTLPGLLQ